MYESAQDNCEFENLLTNLMRNGGFIVLNRGKLGVLKEGEEIWSPRILINLGIWYYRNIFLRYS